MKEWGGATYSSILALIPKERNPSLFVIFRSISFYNTSYKIPTKIIVEILKNIMGKNIYYNFKEALFVEDIFWKI